MQFRESRFSQQNFLIDSWFSYNNKRIKLNCLQGAIFLQIRHGFRMEIYSHILNWCRRIFIKCHTRNRECRKKCSYIKVLCPFNNEMIWFVILMHQKPFLFLKTSLFLMYGIVEGYSSQIYSCGKQFNLLEEYSPLYKH